MAETDLTASLGTSITYPYEAISWSLSDPATGGTDAPGEHHVWFQLRDDQGHWTSAGLAVVFVDLDPPIGSVNLAGETAVGSSDVLLDVTAEDADSSVTDVALSNDGTTWTTRDYAPIQSWTLPPLVGSSVEVWARWRDEIGHWSDPVVGTFLVDTEPPSATAPKARLRVGDAVSSGKVPVALTWSGSDTSSGVVAYQLRWSIDGGTWSAAITTADPSANRFVAPGHSWKFGVRAVDGASNHSSWAVGPTIKVHGYQESSTHVMRHGSWAKRKVAGAWGGSLRSATASGAWARLTFTGTRVAWVARTAPTDGKAAVYLDGKRVATVDPGGSRHVGSLAFVPVLAPGPHYAEDPRPRK